MDRVVIGVDPHKASNTLVMIDSHERVLAQQRFSNVLLRLVRPGYFGVQGTLRRS